MILTDHFYNEEALEAISSLIKDGYDPFELMPDMQAMADEQGELFEKMQDPEFRRSLAQQANQGMDEGSQ